MVNITPLQVFLGILLPSLLVSRIKARIWELWWPGCITLLLVVVQNMYVGPHFGDVEKTLFTRDPHLATTQRSAQPPPQLGLGITSLAVFRMTI